MNNLPTSEEFIASVAGFLIEGGDNDAATLVLACTVEDVTVGDEFFSERRGKWLRAVSIELRGPRIVFDALSDESQSVRRAVQRAFEALLPSDHGLIEFEIRASVMSPGPEWRSDLTDMARGILVHNQATMVTNFRLWQNLRFQTTTEVRIAEALDRAGVLFFPLCRGRVTQQGRRVNREPDFLVCRGGKWGILEVDGAPFHPPSRTVHDHERDRLFKDHGVRVVEHYDSTRCFESPREVVHEFLRILDQSY